MSNLVLRAANKADRREVAELICLSTNTWYQKAARSPIFQAGPESTTVFCDVYEDLDPGCCLLACSPDSGRIMGSCFYHPRPTHWALGIMNVHPEHFGQGVAAALLKEILERADAAKQPMRLVSSAMNLDSYSLYTRAGFIPQRAYQDMFLTVPKDGLPFSHPLLGRVRAARPEDAPAIAELEQELCGLDRLKDYQYFLANARDIWHASVLENEQGKLDGFLVSVCHPGINMLGPGVMRTGPQAAALLLAELQHHRGRTPVFLVPVQEGELVRQLYSWGARNCEIHFHQVRGATPQQRGVIMPTFMPETA